MLTIKTWRRDGDINQTQVEGLDQHDIWAIRAHEQGIQFQRAGCRPVFTTPDVALNFALSIIEVVKTQCNLYGCPQEPPLVQAICDFCKQPVSDGEGVPLGKWIVHPECAGKAAVRLEGFYNWIMEEE